MTCGWEEVFGPVLFIKRVNDFEEGLELMNHSRFANGSCIFTESGYYSREFAKPHARRHGRHQRRHPGAGELLPVRRPQGLASSARRTCSATTASSFFTETKCVTTRWFTEVDKKQKKVSTWEGTVNR